MTSTSLALKEGLDALPVSANPTTWSPEQRVLMESLGLRGTRRRNRGGQWVEEEYEAPPSIVQAFLHQCRTRRLDPFARQIYCIERGGKWGIEASIDGFRLQAERTEEYLGPTEGQWTDGTMEDVPRTHNGELILVDGKPLMVRDYVWQNVWLSSEPPAAARIGVMRKGFSEPVWAVASYEGYCPRDRDGNLKPTGQWQYNASNQLLKCAEMLALRKAFPTELSGLYGAEEMAQAGAPMPTRDSNAQPRAQVPAQPASAPEAPARDWAEELEQVTDLEGLRDLYREAQRAGAFAEPVTFKGVEQTVEQALWKAKEALEETTPPLVEAKPAKVKPREWLREGRALDAEQLRALIIEASSAGAADEVVGQLEEMYRSLSAVEVPSAGWAEDAGDDRWQGSPAVLDAEVVDDDDEVI